MSRYRNTVPTIQYPEGFAQRATEAVENMKANGVADIDGAYMLEVEFPCVDHKIVFPPKTHEQRKAARRAAARGKFCGFVFP